jgi:ATP-binding cassette subfamily A (ABC1) protein 3
MGLANSMYWMSWGLTYLVMFTIMSIAATAISKPSLFHYSDPSLIFLFFFSFSLSLITAACLMTTFFARAKTAGTLSPFLLFLAFLPFFSVSDPQGPTGTKNLASLLSPGMI